LTGVGMALCFSDEDTCGTGTPGVGTPGGSGSYTPTPVRSPEKKTTPIVLGTGIPIFVIFWAVVLFLAIDHQKKKALAVAAATGQTNGTPALGTPVYAEDEQPMHPTVKTTV
ncbi:hypothetical protein MKW94_027235, partial [Papaver nudicaule]|nr:hypothetical protein [Papaver nudicaule]